MRAREFIHNLQQEDANDHSWKTKVDSNNSWETVDNSDNPYADLGDVDYLKNMIKHSEDLRLEPYKDSRGFLTIGYGHKIKPGEDFGSGITQDQADELFDKDFDYHVQAARKLPGYDDANTVRKKALTDLTYNMGPYWGRKFPKFSDAMSQRDYERAAQELENSKWYKQVGRRAPKIVDMIRRGEIDRPEASTAIDNIKTGSLDNTLDNTLDNALDNKQ